MKRGMAKRKNKESGSHDAGASASISWWVAVVIALSNGYRRLLALFFAVIGPAPAYRITARGARLAYGMMDPLRLRSEAQARAALSPHVPTSDIAFIAAQAFVHRAWNLTDLMLAQRLLRDRTYEQYGGRIAEPFRSQMLARQEKKGPSILLSPYYGSFDLLPIFLGYNGIRATVIYRPHSNKGFDVYRRTIRGQSGCEMVPVENAAARLGQVLGTGGTVALITDHHVEERGMPVTFLGVPTKVLRSVGLLAWRYEADIVVAALRRTTQPFHFSLIVADIMHYAEAAGQDDAVAYITDRYLRAMEKIILEAPEQYLWAYPRWGEEHAQRVTAELVPLET